MKRKGFVINASFVGFLLLIVIMGLFLASKKVKLTNNFSITPENLIGVWANSESMPSTWPDTYNFYKSGKYAHIASGMDCSSKDRGEMGTWKLNGNTLLLTVKTKVFFDGGTLVKSSGSCRTAQALTHAVLKRNDLKTPSEVTLELNLLKPNETGYPSVRFGEITFWKFNNPLTDNQPFLSVLPFIGNANNENELNLSGCGQDKDPCFAGEKPSI